MSDVMTREQTTVAIARDILAQIGRDDAPMQFAAGAGYIVGAIPVKVAPGDDVQAHADAIQAHCRVCMLGACLISKARLFDRVPMRVIQWRPDREPGDVTEMCVSQYDAIAHLADAIDPATLAALEAAFEAGTHPIDEDKVTDDVRGAAVFGGRWDDPTDRAVGILGNVIAHGGRLVVDPVDPGEYNAWGNARYRDDDANDYDY